MPDDALIFAMARAIVRANQSKWDLAAEDWSLEQLQTEGFYAAAREVYDAIIAHGYLVSPRKPPPQESIDALADAIRKTFAPAKRITAADAAVALASQLAATDYQVKKV